MNDYLLSILLGIIEGLTEFLPVSSTAHLRIAEALMHIDLGSGYWKMYSIVIQLGAILALPIYFRERIGTFLRTFPVGEREDKTAIDHPLSLILLAAVVTGVPSLLLLKVIGKNLENLYVMGLSLLIGGIIMWIVDAVYGTKPVPTDHIEKMTVGQAIWIGACQILSGVFPGTSRSMSTIAAGQVAGLTRAVALEFSFYVAFPVMVAATGLTLFKTLRPSHKAAEYIAPPHIDAHGWVVLAIGFVVSFLVAYVVIAWFMAWVRKRGFVPFAVYRIIVGIAVLVWAMKLRG